MTTTAKTYAWTIRTDAGMTKGLMAESIDEAAKLWAISEGTFGATPDEDYGVRDLISDIEDIDGAWLWIESEDAPDGERQYAARENMG